MGTVSTNNDKLVEQLNSFLRGELSAVETYRIALEKLEAGSPVREELVSCKASHEQRVQVLKRTVEQLGGKPAENSGAWGAFAKAVESGAAVLGDKIAIAALEEGEDHGLRDYRTDLSKLDDAARQLIASEILPEQEETHRTMSLLKRQIR